MTLRSIPRRVASWLMPLILFGVTVEACARVDDYLSFGASLTATPSMEDLTEVREGGLVGKPGARFEKWRMNNLGLQGPDATEKHTSGLTRVVVIGASETFGLYETPGKAYADQLRVTLQSRGCAVELLNAGLPGMSLPRVIRFVEQRSEELQPDLLVYYPTPTFYLDEEPPAYPPAPLRKSGKSRAPRLVRKAQPLIKGLIPGPVADQLRAREVGQLRRGYPSDWVFSQAPKDRLDLFERHLRLLLTACKERQVKLVLATHANRFPSTLNPREKAQLVAWERFFPRASGAALLEMERLANQRILRVGRETGTSVADVAAAVPAEPAYFADFSHFTDQGSSRAAAAFLAALEPELSDQGSVQSVRGM